MQIQREAERQSFQISEEYDGRIPANGSDFRERMLENNRIEGLLDFDINIINNEKTYEYNVSEMESLDSYCKREKLKNDRLSSVLDGVLQTIFRGREYMLSENDYILDPNLIFVDRGGKTHIAYFSGYGKTLTEQLKTLSEFLMDKVDYHDDRAVLSVYSMYMKSQEEGCTVEELISLVKEKSGLLRKPPEIRKIGGPEFKTENKSINIPQVKQDEPERDNMLTEIKKEDVRKPAEKIGFAEILRAGNSRQKIGAAAAVAAGALLFFAAVRAGLVQNEYGKTDSIRLFALTALIVAAVVIAEKKIWGGLRDRIADNAGRSSTEDGEKDEEATVLLIDNSAEQHCICSLVSDDLKPININHFPYYIGKDREHVDYCLDESGVSRHHLKLDRIGTEIFVTDLNSTNGTMLNDQRLAPNVAYRIARMDKLEIGKCVYYFN